MAWSFVGVSGVVTVTAASHTLTEPAGTQPGDLLVAVISSRIASTTSITLPAGWTRVAESKTSNTTAAATSSEASGMMAYIVRGDDAPDLAFTHPVAPSVAMGRIVAYRGNDWVAPFDVGVGAKTATNITAISTTGLTTAAANELIVKGVCSGRAAALSAHDAATDPTTSSGTNSVQTAAPIVGTWQERQDSSTTTGADTALAIADAIRGTAGATGNLTSTASVAGGHVQVAGAFKIETAATPGSSTITQTGSRLDFITSAANSGTVSSTINVPADAEIVLVGLKSWSGEADYFTNMTFTKGGADTAMTRIGPAEPGNGQTAAIFYLVLPDTGANKSLKYDWAGTNAPGETPMISVTFWKGIDTASPVRSSGTSIKLLSSSVPTRTGLLTAQDGDLVVGFAGGDNPTFTEGSVDTWYNLNLVSQCVIADSIRHDAAWGSFAPSGNLYVGFDTGTNLQYGVCTAIVLKPGAVSVTGTLATTEAADTTAMSGTVRWAATLGAIEAIDASVFSGTVRWAATLATTEAVDVTAFTGAVRWAATLATTEAADTTAIIGSVRWAATLATTEAPDTTALTGSVRWTAVLSTTEAADAAAFLGETSWTATLAATEAADVVAFTGTVIEPPLSGTLATTEAPDTTAVAGTVSWAATLATTELPDITNIAGMVFTPVTGTLAVGESADTTSVAGIAHWLAVLATSEAPDAAAIDASVRWTVTLATTELADAAALTGNVRWAAQFATTEAPDATAFLGTISWTATLAASEAPDAVAFLGGIYAAGSLAASEAPDLAALAGGVFGTGSLATTEAPDSLAFTGGIYASGPLAVTEAPDTYQGSGFVIGEGIDGILNAVEPPDAGVFLATLSGVAGTLDTTEAADAAAFSADARTLAALVTTEAADAASFTAIVRVLGTLAATEAPDTAVFLGGQIGGGILATTEPSDSAAFTGTIRSPATLAATEAPDTAAISGQTQWQATLAATEAADTTAITVDAGALPESASLAAIEESDGSEFIAFAAGYGELAATEEPDSATFLAEFVSTGILDTTEAPDRALFETAQPDIQEAEGRILARDVRRVRSLAGDERVRCLKYPVMRPRSLINNYGDRERELSARRARKFERV